MKKNKKYNIIRLFSSLSATSRNEVRSFTPGPRFRPGVTSDDKDRPEKKDPTEMQIDELFARFTAAINRRGTFSR